MNPYTRESDWKGGTKVPLTDGNKETVRNKTRKSESTQGRRKKIKRQKGGSGGVISTITEGASRMVV